MGKTSVAYELSWVAEQRGITHAYLDLDVLSVTFPPYPSIGRRNLAAIWRNFREAGVRRLVLSQVLSSREDLDQFRSAVPEAEFTVFRLRAALSTLLARLKTRELGAPGEANLRELTERLYKEMESSAVEDYLVETDDRSPHEIAEEILDRSGWRTQS